jgi:hypothetical protein
MHTLISLKLPIRKLNTTSNTHAILFIHSLTLFLFIVIITKRKTYNLSSRCSTTSVAVCLSRNKFSRMRAYNFSSLSLATTSCPYPFFHSRLPNTYLLSLTLSFSLIYILIVLLLYNFDRAFFSLSFFLSTLPRAFPSSFLYTRSSNNL